MTWRSAVAGAVTSGAVVAGLLVSPTAAQAAAPGGNQSPVAVSDYASQETWNLAGLDEQLIRTFDPYVRTRPDGSFRLAVPADVARRHPRDVAVVSAAVTRANVVQRQEARAGTLRKDAVALTRHGGFDTHWWGVSLWLDSYATNKLLNLLWIGAGAATIVAALETLGVITAPAGAVSALVAGIIAVGAGVIGFCSNSKGVVIKSTWAGSPWCHGR